MSFFIRKKPLKRSNRKQNGNVAIDLKSQTANDDEITSESDENEVSEFESDEETVQEKRLRLTKKYLTDIADEERKKLEKDEITNEDISARLKADVLEQAGRLKKLVASKYAGFDDVRTLRNKEHRLPITCSVVSNDFKFIFSCSKDNTIIKWSLAEEMKIISINFTNNSLKTGHKGNIICICLSSDDKYLVSGSSDSIIRVWDPNTLNLVHKFQGHKKSVTGLVFRKNTHHLYSSSYDKSIKVWSLDEMAYTETLFGHQEPVLSIDAFMKDRAISCGGRDNSVRIWKIPEESQLLFLAHNASVEVVKFINDDYFITGSDDGSLSLWGILKKKPLFTVNNAHGLNEDNNPHWIVSLAALPNTDLFASGSFNGTVKLWQCHENYKSFQLLFEIPMIGFINSLSFNKDGTHLIAAVGKEHRLGRWWSFKEVKNSLQVIKFKIKG